MSKTLAVVALLGALVVTWRSHGESLTARGGQTMTMVGMLIVVLSHPVPTRPAGNATLVLALILAALGLGGVVAAQEITGDLRHDPDADPLLGVSVLVGAGAVTAGLVDVYERALRTGNSSR